MLLGAIASGVGSILGAGASSYAARKQLQATRETNASNERIAKANNDWNRESMDLQNSWNLAQWNRENAYNSASAQADRFREAGLNPYLAMTQGANAGMASNMESAPVAPASEVGKQMPADYSGYQAVAQHLAQIPIDIAQAANLGASTDKVQAEADVARATAQQLGIENMYKSNIMDLSMRKMIQSLDIGESYKKQMLVKLDDMRRENALLGDYEVNNARKQEFIQRSYLIGSEAGLASVKAELGKKELKWFDPTAQARVKEIIANATRAVAAANLDNRTSEKVIVDTALAGFDKKIKDAIGIKGIHRIAQSTVRKLEEDSYKARTDRVFAPFDYITRGIGSVAPW